MLAKRCLDLLGAVCGLLLLSPVFLLCALCISADSPGPVYFRQWRVGRHGVPFRIYKFRTMDGRADPNGPLSIRGDTRVTRAGRLLRRYKLDEFPQLINVLLGEMSLVGPRPELPRYVDEYPPRVRQLVLSVAPGMTDPASILYRDEASLLAQAADPDLVYRQTILPAKLAYSMRYVEQRSLRGDVAILIRTLWLLFLSPLWHGLRGIEKPSWQFLPDSKLRDDGWTSVLLNGLRGLAALEVAAAHLRAHVFPSLRAVPQPSGWYQALAFGTGFAHQAVVVFFLLSGWLVGGALLGRAARPGAVRDYAIDRLSRLWTVLVPALLLTYCLAAAASAVSGHAVNGDWYSMHTALGNLVGLQNILVHPYGNNLALWSLSNEIWYYLLFPFLLMGWFGNSLASRSAALLLALGALWLLPSALSIYFLIWLLGAAAAHLRIESGTALRALAALLFAGLAVALRLAGYNDDLTVQSSVQDLCYSLLFLFCLCSMRRDTRALTPRARKLAAGAAFLASFSFTLYVLHIPLIELLWAYRGKQLLSPLEPVSMAIYAAMLTVIVALCYLVYLVFEAQTQHIRRFLKRQLRVQPPVAAHAKPDQ
jgi:lipopolysaccharide/colanic/teichoic acid biosynthesis glycosyltransferase/peptidoglycan/LPS O-acetylase OafA/YrhL